MRVLMWVPSWLIMVKFLPNDDDNSFWCMNAFLLDDKKSTDFDQSRYNGKDNYFRPLTFDHDKDNLTNHCKILPNLTLTIA